MRPDMAKVIVERPRHNHAESYRPFRAASKRFTVEEDGESDARTRERMKPPGYDQVKSLNENLQPLRNFLSSRCGRPWNKVHSEICEHLRLTSAVQKHVLDHLKDFVYTHSIEEENGRLYVRRYGGRTELNWWEFYVDKHGFLRQYHPPARKREKPVVIDVQRDGKWLAKILGIWYELTLEKETRTKQHVFKYYKLPLSKKLRGYEHTLVDPVCKSDIVFGLERGKRWTAKGFVATAKKQLNKKELRKYGLVNET